MARQGESNVRDQLNMLVSKALLSREVAMEDMSLPLMKVGRVERFGGLQYANGEFYTFVERLEFMFRHTLTPKLLAMNGFYIIDLVHEILNTEECVRKIVSNFCEDNIDDEIIGKVTQCITQTYCRMQGKDFICKLMSRETHSLKQTRRSTRTAVSDPVVCSAKRKKFVSLDSTYNEINYLLFHATAGNSATEDKGVIDYANLLES